MPVLAMNDFWYVQQLYKNQPVPFRQTGNGAESFDKYLQLLPSNTIYKDLPQNCLLIWAAREKDAGKDILSVSGLFASNLDLDFFGGPMGV